MVHVRAAGARIPACWRALLEVSDSAPVGPPVERALERDDRGAPGGVARQLDRALHRLGAGVGEEDPLLATGPARCAPSRSQSAAIPS